MAESKTRQDECRERCPMAEELGFAALLLPKCVEMHVVLEGQEAVNEGAPKGSYLAEIACGGMVALGRETRATMPLDDWANTMLAPEELVRLHDAQMLPWQLAD